MYFITLVLDELRRREKISTQEPIYWSLDPEDTLYPGLIGVFFLAKTLEGALLKSKEYGNKRGITTSLEDLQEDCDGYISQRTLIRRYRGLVSILERIEEGEISPPEEESISSTERLESIIEEMLSSYTSQSDHQRYIPFPKLEVV